MDVRKALTSFIGNAVVIVALATAIAFTAAGTLAQSDAVMVAIASMAIGAAPKDYEFARTGQGTLGTWTVVADNTAQDGRAIEQSSTDTTDHRFPLAIHQPVSARDVEATIRFKAVAGRVDRAGGVAVRLLDADNYYVARANALEDNVRFYRVVKGRREQLAGADLKVASGEWHTLALKAEGDRFTVTFNGKMLYTVRDATFIAAGKVALWTKADSVTRFDLVQIKTLP